MTSKTRFALLVQGPIKSSGFGPFEWLPNGRYAKRLIHYEALSDVQEWITQGKELFNEVIVSVWDYPKIQELSTYCVEQKVHLIENNEDDNLRQIASQTHKYHQIQTTLNGLKRAIELNCEYVAKVRTDHRLDIRLLRDQLARYSVSGTKRQIGIPYLSLYETNRLTDFYWIGRSTDLFDVMREYMDMPEFSTDTHEDYFCKFAIALGNSKWLPEKIRERSGAKISFIDSMRIWSENFYPINRRLYESIVWRGVPIDYGANKWIRWYVLFKTKSRIMEPIFFVMNFGVVLLFRLLKRPTIKVNSFFYYRRTRRRFESLKSSNLR